MSKKNQSQAQEEPTRAQLEAENAQFYPQLTKRNASFIYQLLKILQERESEASYPMDLVKIEHHVMKEMLTTQSQGTTAQQLYGTPTEFAERLLERPMDAKEEPSKGLTFQALWWDGALLIGGMFAAIAALTVWTKPQADVATYGITTLVLNFIFGGLGMAALTYYQLHLQAQKDKHPILKYIGLGLLVIMAWVGIVVVATNYLPAYLNPVLPALAYALIAAAAFALRWWLKRKGTP